MKKLISFRNLALTVSSCTLAVVVSCTPYQQQGAAIGALGGAGLGAIAGDDTGDVLTGAALGAAAGTGVAAYREEQTRRSRSRQPFNNNAAPSQQTAPPTQRPSYQPPPRTANPPLPQTSRTSSGSYPVATPSIKPNTVISPYPPYNVLDTTGAKSGDKLCDPSTIPIDPATGKQYTDPRTGLPDVKRGKYFIVP